MEELIECICDYVRKPYTDYAIMLNGEWGSGKTYFWNNKLRSRLESISIGGKKYKTIYMSLYGINSLEEISKKIYIETNPMISKTLKKFVDSREGNLIPEYVKTGLDMANLFGTMQFSNEKVDFSKLFAIDDKILCFDDLERANVDVIDILGYINNFVEHDGIKTIVICNEKELATKFKNTNLEFKTMIATYILDKENKLKINEKSKVSLIKELPSIPLANMIEEKISEIFDKANAYERIKEKLIGETFEYIPEYSYILSGMIMKYSYNEALSDFLKRNTSSIIFAFNKSETKNLRILKHSLADFEKIFNCIMKDYPNTPTNVLKTLLIFTIAVSFEIKAGNILKEKLKSVKNNTEYNSIVFTSKILNDNNQFYLKEFDNKYFLNNDSNFKFFKFVEVYIRTRFFDEKLYKDNMQEANEFIDITKTTANIKYLSILEGDYLKISDFDFNILVRQVLDEIKLGLVEFNKYIQLFIIYKYFITTGLLKMNISELKQIFILGMQIAGIENNQNIENDKLDIPSDDKDVIEMKTNYDKIKKQIIEDLSMKKAVELFKNLPSNISEFYKDIVGNYQNLPVFSKYDMEDLYNKLDITANYDLYNLVNMFTIRYKENEKLFKLDAPNLKKLCEIITKNKALKERTIKLVLLDNIASVIEKYDKQYN
ncbi:MAG: P-loop NTPase fold protein [Clostridia bacterium]